MGVAVGGVDGVGVADGFGDFFGVGVGDGLGVSFGSHFLGDPSSRQMPGEGGGSGFTAGAGGTHVGWKPQANLNVTLLPEGSVTFNPTNPCGSDTEVSLRTSGGWPGNAYKLAYVPDLYE